MGQSSTLIYALSHGSFTHIFCGNYAAVNAQLDEAVTLANEKSALGVEGLRNDASRFAIGLDRPSLERSPNNDLRHQPNGGPRDQHCGYRCVYQRWLRRMRKSADLMMHGVVLAKQSAQSNRRRKNGLKPKLIELQGKPHCARAKVDTATAEGYFNRALEVARQQQAKSGDSAPQRASPASGVIRASRSKLANCSLWSTGGSLRGSTLAI